MSSVAKELKIKLSVPEQADSHKGLGFLSSAQMSSGPDGIQHETGYAPATMQNPHPYVGHYLQENQAQMPISNSFPVHHPGLRPGASQPWDTGINQQALTNFVPSACQNPCSGPFAAAAPGIEKQPITPQYPIPGVYPSAQNSLLQICSLSQTEPQRRQNNQPRPAPWSTQNNDFNILRNYPRVQTPREGQQVQTGCPSQKRQNHQPDSVFQNGNEFSQSNDSQQKNDSQQNYATQGGNENGKRSLDNYGVDSEPARNRRLPLME
ncbi:hypothetical protein Daus18300_000918 [Diaporthe australafricana]|uniref:Uncharacterized protein n=1 Tax=Diaporthe australafricana TaxID=127596 RepID=A0ABR3Y1L7_9PEZI